MFTKLESAAKSQTEPVKCWVEMEGVSGMMAKRDVCTEAEPAGAVGQFVRHPTKGVLRGRRRVESTEHARRKEFVGLNLLEQIL